MANARTQFDALASSLQQHGEATQGQLAGRSCLSFEGEPFLVLYHEGVAFRLAGSAQTRALGLSGAENVGAVVSSAQAPRTASMSVAVRASGKRPARER